MMYFTHQIKRERKERVFI